MIKKLVWGVGAVIVLVLAIVYFGIVRDEGVEAERTPGAVSSQQAIRSAARSGSSQGEGADAPGAEDAETEGGAPEGVVISVDSDETDASAEEAEAEALVEAFDKLTDEWSDAGEETPKKAVVKMADIDKFVAQFKKLPADRKEECLQRALNLVPDDNVMLLAGVLLDKSVDKEYVELVFNDILNRDEDVKKPVLKEIFKDKNHPCWADVAWILDVTGENEEAK